MTTLFSISTDDFHLHWRLARGNVEARDRLWDDTPGRLIVTPRSTGSVDVDRYAPSHLNFPTAPEATSLGPRLEEETTYHVYIRPKASAPLKLMHEDPVLLSNIDMEDDGTVHGTLNFRSDVGSSRFTVLVAGRPQVDFEVEVFPSKLDYETDYRALVAEVQDLATGLALDYLRSTYQFGHAYRGDETSSIEWTLLLRHVIDDLEQALHHIAQRPRRSLQRDPKLVRTEAVRRTDSAVRSAIQRGSGSGPFTQMKNGLRVRSKIWSRPAEPTLDTPEHRWLASRTRRISRRLRALEDALRGTRSIEDLRERRRAVIGDLSAFQARVGQLERLEPLTAAEGEPPPGFTSQQLLGAPGYREAYQACVLLDAGLRLDGRAIRASTRALHELYEYWCYLTVIRLIAQHTRAPIEPSDLFSLRTSGLRLELQRGQRSSVRMKTTHHEIQVRYNPGFNDEPMLVPQRPDIVITFSQREGPEIHLVLDVKYRRDASESYIQKYGGVGPPEDALNIMHRYRDAILYAADESEAARRVVVEAAAVFPHRDAEASPTHSSSRNWQLLDRMGVGAIPALPGSTEYLSEWVTRAMRQGGWSLGDRAIRHAAADQIDHWRESAREQVLVVPVSDADELPARVVQPWRDAEHQLRARWIAFTTSADGPPRLVGYRPVEALSVESSRDGERLQADYELGEFTARDIPAPSAAAVPPAWTTKLALDRATHIGDLYARTEAEWRLREQLVSHGFSPEVEVPIEPGAHPWIVAAEGRVRYAAAGGFEVRDRQGRRRELGRIEDVIEALEPS